jgi:hypothetical protein
MTKLKNILSKHYIYNVVTAIYCLVSQYFNSYFTSFLYCGSLAKNKIIVTEEKTFLKELKIQYFREQRTTYNEKLIISIN